MKGLTSDAILYYIDNPVDFVEDIIGAKPDVNQKAILNSLAKYPMTSVRSGHGIGKSAVEAWALMIRACMGRGFLFVANGVYSFPPAFLGGFALDGLTGRQSKSTQSPSSGEGRPRALTSFLLSMRSLLCSDIPYLRPES